MFKNLIIRKTNLNIYLFEFHNALNPSYHLAPDSMSITIIPFMHVNLEPRSFDLGASELRQCIDFEQAIPHLDRSSSSKRSRIHRFDLISVSFLVYAWRRCVSARPLTGSQIEFPPDARTSRHCNAVSCV